MNLYVGVYFIKQCSAGIGESVYSGFGSKLRYLLSRAFSTKEIYTNWPFFKKHKWLLPVAWFYRLIRPVFDKKRREKLRQELKTVRSLRQKA